MMAGEDSRETWRESMFKGVYAQFEEFRFHPAGAPLPDGMSATTLWVFLHAVIYCAGRGRRYLDSPLELPRDYLAAPLDHDAAAIFGNALDLVRASFEDVRDAREALHLGAEWLASHWDALDEREGRADG